MTPEETAAIRQPEPPDCVVRDAIRASLLSPCRSKRGAVVFTGDTVFTSGCNHQVQPLTCDGSDACKARCRETAVHAEQVAIGGANKLLHGLDILHVKTVDGRLVPSGPPSCVQCSKLIVLSGIAGVWLYHADGWVRYDVLEFHRLSSQAKATNRQPSAWTEFGDGHDYSRTGKHDPNHCRLCLRVALDQLEAERAAARAENARLREAQR